MRNRILMSLMIALPAMIPLSSQAAGIPDPAEGKKLAQMECVNCHVIENVADKSTAPRSPGEAPYFRSIAFDPKMTAEKIRSTLKLPHGEMANILLTEKDIDNLILYIEGMRRY
jgi:mono/diheme cytochrome c family protein